MSGKIKSEPKLDELMKHRMLISPLTLALVLLFSIASNALARVKVSELSAAALVQRLAHHTTKDSCTRNEISKRLGSEALPRQRSELIDALLSVAKNATAHYSHRISAMVYLTHDVKEPVVIDAYMEIAMNDSDELSCTAARKLPYLSRENPRILSFLIEYLESLDSRAAGARAINSIIVAIGVCGEIATDTLFDLWNNKRYNRDGHRVSLYSAFGCTAARSTRSLDFLISQLKEKDLKTFEGNTTSILYSLSSAARVATGSLNDFLDPPHPTDYAVASKIQSAVEPGLRAENHPDVIKAAATAYLHATRGHDLPATISRLQGFLPYLEPKDQEDLEFLFRWKWNEVNTSQNPPLWGDPPLMDRVPAPPLR